MPRGECRSLWEIPGAHEFYERHRYNQEHKGLVPTPNWRPKDRRNLDNAGEAAWRWDAVRFFKQCIIPHATAQGLPDDHILVWQDADAVTFAPVPELLFPGLLGRADLCYLGRNKGAEIGSWAVRLNGKSRWFLRDFSEFYLEDRVFGLQQTHSAFVFDHVRQLHQRSGLSVKDLTPGGRDHVFCTSPIGKYVDHLKGPRRKKLGYSPEHPLRWWERK